MNLITSQNSKERPKPFQSLISFKCHSILASSENTSDTYIKKKKKNVAEILLLS